MGIPESVGISQQLQALVEGNGMDVLILWYLAHLPGGVNPRLEAARLAHLLIRVGCTQQKALAGDR